jgi:hypothetical protein
MAKSAYAIVAVALAPPPGLEVMEYGVPPPRRPDEIVHVGRPAPFFDGPDFGFMPPPVYSVEPPPIFAPSPFIGRCRCVRQRT